MSSTPRRASTLLGLLGLALLPAAVSAQIVTGSGPGSNATVRVIDVDGTDRSFLSYPIGFGGGTTVALGDINGDGVRDIITGAGPSGGPHVRVWNGVDLIEIGGFFAYDPAFPGGVSVAAGDVNGDGHVDIITGAGPGGGPHVRVWSGVDFTEIGGFFAYHPAFGGGVSVAAGDVDGDGLVDIITGAGPGGGPHVRVWSGADFHEIGGFMAYDPAFAGGVHVASGDVNGDGLADIITGAGPGGGPHVRVWNGATFAEIGGFFAYDPSFAGGVRVGALDLTYDGRVELLTVPGPGAGALVAIWTSDTFGLMGAYFAYDPAFTGGASIASPAGGSGLARFTSADTTTFSVGTPGTFDVTTVGGAVPTLTVTGALPTGVTFTDNGDRTATLAGTPAASTAGTYPLTFTATSGTATPVTQAFTLTVGCQAITVTPAGALPSGAIGAPYSQAFAATGGTAPHTFSISAGAPPPPLTLGPTGVLSGTPTQAGSFTFTVTATDALGCSGAASVTLAISCPAITVTPTTVPDAIATVPYGPVTFSQTGAGAPVTWSISSGTPPAGITISPTTGELSGTAGAPGTFTFIVTAATAAGCTGSVSITLTVQTGPNQAPSFTVGPNQTVLEDGPPQNVAGWATGISPGPPHEAGQSVAFNVTGNSNPSLFSVAPAVSPTGTLTYALAANANGVATITLVLQDSGGTAGGGVDTSAPQSFTITVTAVNDAPSFTVGPNQTVSENSGAHTVTPWATAISPGPTDEALQTLTFNVTGNTNAALFTAGPAVSATGTLTFTLAPGQVGSATITLTLSDSGGTANGGVDTTTPQTFTITVTGVNDAPSFTIGPNQIILEDAAAQSVPNWATAISPGPPDEALQTVTFNVTGNTNPALFSAGPLVSPTGTLTYTPAANAVGTATITLVLQDSGGTAGGGVDTSAPQSFTITVTAVNDAPSFTVGPNQTVSENSGAHTVTPWATAISPGPTDEALQTLTFNVTGNTNAALFTAGPAVSATGTLTFTLAPGQVGSATITLTLSDSGGTANGGVDTTTPQTFTITVTGVNDAPSFTIGPNQIILEDAAAQSVPNWATAISPGPPDEALQTVTFNVTGNTNPALFSAGPLVSPTGTLTYTAAVNVIGTATITLTLSDNGGTAGGGSDTSAPQSFTITVNAVNDAPSFVAGANPSSIEDAGPQTVNPWATAISAGPADEAGQTLAFAVTGNTNPALFSTAPAVSPAGVLTYTSAPNAFGSANITIVLQDNGGIADGGVNTSAPVTFTITITPVNDPPALTVPVITYATAGNTQLHVAGATRPGLASIADAVSILTKSGPTDSDGPAAPTVVAFSGATPNGTATLNADGSFTYVPNAGFTGTDSFSFQVTDGATAVTGTIQVTVGPRVWYVSNQIGPNNAAGGDGRSTDAFDTLTAAETASAANDIIFVFNGDSQTTALGGITLKNGQKLYGEGIGLTIAPFGTIVPAGTAPQLTSAANTIAVLANTANGDRTGVEIRGLSLASTGGNAIDVTSADAATLGVRISENTITGSGVALDGIDINQGSTGTATLSVHDNVITASGTGLDITRTAGTVVITAFDDNTVSGNTVGSGIVVTGGVTFDATPGGILDAVSGGTTRIGASGNGVGGPGLVLTSVTGVLDFVELDIFADIGAALSVIGTGTFTGAAGTSITVDPGASDITAAAGPAALLTNLTTDLQLGGLTSTNSAAQGVLLNGVDGTFTAPSGGAISNAAGVSFNVSGGTATISYGGNITHTGGAAMVAVSGHTAGAITFGGTLNATSGTGLQFDNADSITNFTGTTMLNGGDAGIDIINGSAGTFTFVNTTITNPTGTAFFLSDSNATVTYSGSISDNTGFAVDINNHDGGTVVFATGAITSTGTGIQVANSNGGTINFNSPTIALTTGATKAVTVDVNNVGGTIDFNPAGGGGGLDISTTTGTGFSALGGGTISVQGTGNSIIAGAGGMALEMLNVIVGGAGVNFGTTTSGGGVRNVKLTGLTGTGAVSLGTGALSGATSAAFLVGDGAGGANSGGTAAITYGGTITTTGTVRAVDIQDRALTAGNVTLSGTITHSSGNANVIFLDGNAAGTIAFSGANSVLNGGTSTAVSLTNNTGATVNFTGGGLDIDATSGSGFVATGGGTVSVTGTLNTIVTTTGTALNLSSTIIGASGLTFRSISANGAVNGIVLNGTGSNGLTVTGDGSLARNGSGGTIQNTTDDAIALTNASNVTLQSMSLISNGDTAPAGLPAAQDTTGEHTVQISGGSNIVLSGVLIQDPAGSGMVVLNLGGTNRINNDSLFTGLTDGVRHGLFVSNTNTNMTLFEFRNSAMKDSLNDASMFFFANNGTSNMTLDVKGSTFENLDVQALTVAAGGLTATTGTLTSTIGGPNPADRNFFQNAHSFVIPTTTITVTAENNVGVLVNNGATHISTVQNNLFDNIAEEGQIANTSIVRTQNSGGVMTATVTANTIQNISYAAGAGGRHVIGHVFEPVSFSASNSSTLVFTNNTISNVTFPSLGNNREAFFVDYRLAASGGEVTILGNTINMPTSGSQQAIELRFRQTNASNVNVLVRGNTITHNTAANFLDVDAEDGANLQLTVDGGNNFTNPNATPGQTIAVATEDPGALGGPPSMCVNITGNTLQSGAGTITLDETAGTMNVTQASAAAMAAANGIPGGSVSVSGTPAFGQPACTIP